MRNEVVIECKLGTKSFEKQIKEVEYQLKEIDFELSHAKELKLSSRSIDELNKRAEELNNRLTTLKKKQSDIDKQGLKNFEKSLSTIGDKTGNIIKKIGKWALAIFGIRTAYNAVRGAISTLAQYDDQLATDVEYIRYALATTLEPVIKSIVNLVYTLLQYVNYLAKAWFNVDLFAGASEKRFKKAGKAAKDMNKTLFGFDTANVLGGGGAAATGGGTPSMDLSAPEDVPIPKWLEWIKDNGELIIGIIAGITTAILVLKLTALGPIELLISGIIVAVGLLVAVIIKYWDEIKSVFVKVATWINENVIQPVINFFKGLWNGIVEIFSPIVEFFKSLFATIFENIKTIFNNIAQIFVWLWNKVVEIFSPFVNFIKDIFKEAIKSLQPFIDAVVGLWDKVKGALKKFGVKVGEVIGSAFKTTFNAIMKTIETFLNTPIKAINGLIKIINKVPGINLDKLTEFKLPRLAVGGVVNMPGRGVYRGGGIVGEQGAEGVIPLTNDQSLQMIANAIAEKMSITLDITNKLDGRVLNKQLEQVRARNNFARNGV